MHVPGPTNVIDEPLSPATVHTSGVVVVKVTSRPDVAVALTITGDWSMVLAPMAGNEMVWRTRTSSRRRSQRADPGSHHLQSCRARAAGVEGAAPVRADREHCFRRPIAERVPEGIEPLHRERLRGVRTDHNAVVGVGTTLPTPAVTVIVTVAAGESTRPSLTIELDHEIAGHVRRERRRDRGRVVQDPVNAEPAGTDDNDHE